MRLQTRHRVCFPAGFSLVELSVVLVIIAVVTAIAVPRYLNSLDRYRVRAAAKRIAADWKHARAQARARSTSLKIEFHHDHDHYKIHDDEGETVVELWEPPYHADIAKANFDGSDTIELSSTGQISSGGAIKLIVGKATLTVTIDGETGEVNIE